MNFEEKEFIMGWRASDGTEHETELDRDYHQQHVLGTGASNASSDAMVGAAGKGLALVGIILVIAPAVVAGIYSLIFNLLFKAGKVGRILQAALVGTLGGITITVSCFYIPKLTPLFSNTAFAAFIIILPSVLLSMWYYFSHYFTLKLFREAGKGIVSFFLFTFSIAFYGTVVAFIVRKATSNETLFLLLIVVSLIGAVAYYLVNLRSILSDKDEIKDIKEEEGLFPIGAIPALALALIIPIMVFSLANSSRTRLNAEYAEGTTLEVIQDTSIFAETNFESEKLAQLSKGETLTSTGTVTKVISNKETYTLVSVDYNGTKGWVIAYQTKRISNNVVARPAKNGKERKIVAEYASGTVLLVNQNGKITLYEEPNELSKVVIESHNKGGEKFISNGEVLFDPISNWKSFVPVSYNGVNVWISTREISPIMGIATVVSDKAEFTLRNTYDDKDQGISHPAITLKKGDTFEVLSVSKQYKNTNGVYNGTLGFVRSSDITVAKGR